MINIMRFWIIWNRINRLFLLKRLYKTIKFARKNKNMFIDFLTKGTIRNNTKEMTEKFLASPKVDFGDNWMEEIDTIEHEDMLRRNKK